MVATTTEGQVPRPVAMAALMMWGYALWVVGAMVWFLATGGDVTAREASRAGLRFGGIAMAGLYLFTLRNSAWWTAMILTGSLAVLGMLSLALLSFASVAVDGSLWRLCLQLVPGVGFLSGAAYVLAKRDTRDLFS